MIRRLQATQGFGVSTAQISLRKTVHHLPFELRRQIKDEMLDAERSCNIFRVLHIVRGTLPRCFVFFRKKPHGDAGNIEARFQKKKGCNGTVDAARSWQQVLFVSS